MKSFSRTLVIGILSMTALLGGAFSAHAQVGEILQGVFTSMIPSANIPLMSSPYMLNSAGIKKNPANNTWTIPYITPEFTYSSNFVLQINGTTVTGNNFRSQILNGQLVFTVPDASFAKGGTALVGLVRKNPLQVVALDAVLVLAQGLQPSPYILDFRAVTRTDDGGLRVPYLVPENTDSTQMNLSMQGSTVSFKGTISGPHLVFQIPDNYIVAGTQTTFTLKDGTGTTRSANVVTIPQPLAGYYILNRAEIKQDPTYKTWSIPYLVPKDINSNDFELLVGTKGKIDHGTIVNNALVFTVDNSVVTGESIDSLILRNRVTGRMYAANGTMTQGAPDEETPDTTRFMGGLVMTFPADRQDIKQTSAFIRTKIRAVIPLPEVNVAYIWNKSEDPASNTTVPLLVIPFVPPATPPNPPKYAMNAGEEREVTLAFTGLTPGVTYQFVIRNNITNTTTDPIQFTTPTKAGEAAYLSYATGEFTTGPGGDDSTPWVPGGIEDDISDKGIVPLCGRTWTEGSSLDKDDDQFQPCGIDDFFQLITNLIRFGLIIIGPIVGILILYSGFQIMIYGRVSDPTSEQMAILKNAKMRLVKVFIGLGIIISAWVLIATITRELGVKSEYTLLDILSGK